MPFTTIIIESNFFANQTIKSGADDAYLNRQNNIRVDLASLLDICC